MLHDICAHMYIHHISITFLLFFLHVFCSSWHPGWSRPFLSDTSSSLTGAVLVTSFPHILKVRKLDQQVENQLCTVSNYFFEQQRLSLKQRSNSPRDRFCWEHSKKTTFSSSFFKTPNGRWLIWTLFRAFKKLGVHHLPAFLYSTLNRSIDIKYIISS
jgi:hypothetical protein